MQFEESPDLNSYKEGLPEPPPGPGAQRKRFRVFLLLIMFLVLLLSVVNFMGSQTAALLTQTGKVTGAVIDQDGDPFRGEIFVLGTDLAVSTDTEGRFNLDRVPAGSQLIIVADDLLGREFPVQVLPGEAAEMGQIQFVPTATR